MNKYIFIIECEVMAKSVQTAHQKVTLKNKDVKSYHLTCFRKEDFKEDKERIPKLCME